MMKWCRHRIYLRAVYRKKLFCFYAKHLLVVELFVAFNSTQFVSIRFLLFGYYL